MDNNETTTTGGGLTETKFRDLLVKALELAEEEFGSDMPVSSLVLLLKLSTKTPTPMSQIVKVSKLTPAGVSRTVSTFAGYSKINRREVEKPYLYLTEDPADRRYKYVAHTDYGKQIINRLLSVVY